MTLAASLVLLCACGRAPGGDAGGDAGGNASATPQRIVLISLDTLRADRFTPERMPRTLARARHGRRFTRHYAATSTTQPAHAVVFTGLPPWENGVTRNGQRLAPERVTLAERLHQAGFETRAVVASYPLSPPFGFDQGFDHYEADFSRSREGSAVPGNAQGGPSFYSLAPAVTAKALAALDAMHAPRQFLFVHYFDAHEPYGDDGAGSISLAQIERVIREEGGEDVAALLTEILAGYDRDVATLDRCLDRLLARLEEDPLPTFVVVFADHGESLGEGGIIGHGKDLCAEQIRVPCFVLGPGVEPEQVETPVGSLDVHATVLACAGLPEVPGRGRDLRAELFPQPISGMRRTFIRPYTDLCLDGEERHLAGLRFYLVDGEDLFVGNAGAVEAMHGTPAERLALRAEDLRERFGRYAAELEGRDAREVDDRMTRSAMRALGYAR